ncbi:MAG TPA: 50S ribosomal protein L25/general stress protein Ctc [Terriglobia bacterium]|nr:50S ribosomal protein L25/general stress protein Ctc [Terriglobia bacterium]
MAEIFTVEAEARETFGKNAARRLRHSGRIPAVVYGGGGPSVSITVDPKEIVRILRSEAGHNALFSLQIPDKAPARVMLRDWQWEPIKGGLMHVDMVRIARDEKLEVRVPIRITGEPQGVKLQGGVLEFILREVAVECLPDDIPEHITVDVSDLVIGRQLRVSDLPVPASITVLAEPGRVVAHVVAPKAEAEPTAEAAEAAPAPTEPELIRKRKAEEEEGAEDEKEEKSEGKKEKK